MSIVLCGFPLKYGFIIVQVTMSCMWVCMQCIEVPASRVYNTLDAGMYMCMQLSTRLLQDQLMFISRIQNRTFFLCVLS